ncbi:MAG: DMT family transporter [Treponema sp.]
MTKKQKGILFIIISAFLFALMNLFVKLSGDLPPIQKAFFRNAGAFIISLIVILKQKKEIKLKLGSLPLLIFRALFGTMGIICNFYALTHLQLSDASTLSKLAPFFVVIFSFLFLKENIKPYQFIAILIAFLASLLIVKPSFSGSNYTLYAIIATCGAMGAGIAYTCIRALSKHNVNGAVIVFFFSFISCLIMLPFSIIFYKHMALIQIGYLIGASVSGALAQFAVTQAYIHAPGKEISLYDYSQVIFASLMGYVFYEEFPDIYSILGYVLIFLASFYMFIKKN